MKQALLASSRWLPWRSAVVARTLTTLALVVGVPLFLRMPPWCDLTLYDVAAQNLLRGGVHYRDVFDTNLPGFVWILTAIRATFGWSTEVVRCVDLLIVTGIVVLLDRLAAYGGATRSSRAWMVAGVAIFYPFTSEFNHAQRDVWMMLPALGAVVLRYRQFQTVGAIPFRSAVLQGVVWGLAVWIKPHVVVPAACVWLSTLPRLKAQNGWSGVATDLIGNVVGGGAIGLMGVAYLIASGTWEPFVEVFTFWNPGYFQNIQAEFTKRVMVQLDYFPPWGYLQLASVPLALGCLVDGLTRSGYVGQKLPAWLWQRADSEQVRFGRLILAALYVGWSGQALVLQKDLHYAHVSEVFFLLALLSTHRWAPGALMATWLTITSVIVGTGLAPAQNPHPALMQAHQPLAWIIQHPALDMTRLKQWPACWRKHLSPRDYFHRRMTLAQVRNFAPSTNWTEIYEIVQELERRGATDDVICWHDSPHVVYAMAHFPPAYRFQHVSNMIQIGPAQEARMWAELQAATHARYVVSDLEGVFCDERNQFGPDRLPPKMPASYRNYFPYDQPVIFRSGMGHGRYMIHELTKPIHPLYKFDP